MKISGTADLPLHYGNAPRWLFERMRRLARAIGEVILNEYGSKEFIKRISNPYWFQAFACLLGFDWHSSGTTTVTIAALKESGVDRFGLFIVGGKGKAGLRTTDEIKEMINKGIITDKIGERLIYISRMCSKIDNVLIQDGFDLYQHSLIFDEKARWAVVQQGMNNKTSYARRYHWLYVKINNMIKDEHDICCDIKQKNVLNLTGKKSDENRKVCVDIVNEGKERIRRYVKEVIGKSCTGLNKWFRSKELAPRLDMPRKLNWNVFDKLYEVKPKRYEEIVRTNGMGKENIRALALIAEVIYGKEADWKDPVKFSYAHGGKDGVPYPVNKKVYDESIRTLENFIEQAKLCNKDKEFIKKKLMRFKRF